MALHNKSFFSNLNLQTGGFPSWDSISDEEWRNVLSNYVFKISDSFAFNSVFKKADLFPEGLNYFADWELHITGLAEAEGDIVCKFRLNDNCRSKLLEYEFAVHHFESEKFLNYYEFDSLYFFSDDRLITIYINHESEIMFLNLNDNEDALIDTLEPHIKSSFIDSSVFREAIIASRKT
ncbi:hypothetical protein HMJ29_17070 [Hymenobacter taeanensis]|uniref:Uncharacterized protein n=1 Tax=Hymenobacter taeanensis TaxID=2735321 RepID=A0A6M6BN90_9BACT|nr:MULTISPECIES: hypothetical protein [Hymenobacter]QJX48535.1 hypothetical protein HMJ29_17070 [Hymenobacter taeanensis]UOQ81968.1 hypothetical protein MUN83_04040 [Hymenobacter sp. 5414T-23]